MLNIRIVAIDSELLDSKGSIDAFTSLILYSLYRDLFLRKENTKEEEKGRNKRKRGLWSHPSGIPL